MQISSNILLWIAVIVLVAVVAYLGWRLWQASQQQKAAHAPPAELEPMAPTPGYRPVAASTERRGAPPPTWAGERPATSNTPGRSPAASAGPAAGGQSYSPPRPRTSKPPPALAGDVPGVTPAASAGRGGATGTTASKSKPRGAPPAASA